MKTKSLILCTFLTMFTSISLKAQYTVSKKEIMAEDSFDVDRQTLQNNKNEPWGGRSPVELRLWEKENLHHKLTAKIIDSAAHLLVNISPRENGGKNRAYQNIYQRR